MTRYKLLVFAIIAPLVSCRGIGFTCDEDSRAVAAARALDGARLERLYADAEELFRKTPTSRLGPVEVSPIPDEFKDIDPILMRVHSDGIFPDSVLLRLKGCLDHHVDLHVNSIAKADASITVSWGEGPTAGDEVLWRRGED